MFLESLEPRNLLSGSSLSEANPVITLDTNFGPIQMELYVDEAPITVNNFLKYVNDGDYTNTFFHRSATDFVIQAGGFTTSSTTFTSVSQFSTIPTDAAITNEPGISNTVGTVAMAKLGGNPNSATDQFFVNLGDNSSNLDSQNGGFTVFAKVLDMTTVAAIAAMPVNTSNAAPYNQLPVSSTNQLAVVHSITGDGYLTGKKFLDADSDGVLDSGETGIAGIKVYLDANNNSAFDAGEVNATTDSDGVYTIQVAPGTYTLRAAVSSGRVETLPTASAGYPVTVQIGIEQTNLNFGEANVGSLPAAADAYSTNEDTTLSIAVASGVLANDGTSLSGTVTAVLAGNPSHGTLTLNSNGSFTYVPNSNFNGTDTLTYRATDGVNTSAVTAATITVAAINDVPTGVADSYSATENTTLTISADKGVLANDTDVDGNALTAALATQAGHGTVTLSTDGSFTYVPTTGYKGSDSFTYTASDGTASSSATTVTLTVVAAPPTVLADSYSVNEDSVLTVATASGVLSNDSDPHGATITAAVDTQPSHGTLSLTTNGSFTYTPAANYYGTDSFTYVASNGENVSTAATVTLTVNNTPDAPTATADSATATNDGTVTKVDVLANDSSNPDPSETLTITSVTQGTAGGTVAINGDSIDYTAPEGYEGTDTFTYTIKGSDGLTSTATVTMTDQSADNIISGYVYVDADGDGTRDSGEVGVPGVLITLTGDKLTTSQTAISANDGSYTFTGLASGTYQATEKQPEAMGDGKDSTSASGAVAGEDQFTNIVLSGGQSVGENNFGEQSLHAAFVSIRLFLASTPASSQYLPGIMATAEEQAGNSELAAAIRSGRKTLDSSILPVAVADSYSNAAGTALIVKVATGVLANDTNPAGGTLTATVVSQPSHGSLTLNSNGSFTYTPAAGFQGTDTFRYTAGDGVANSPEADVTINVVPANLADQALTEMQNWL